MDLQTQVIIISSFCLVASVLFGVFGVMKYRDR